MSGDSLSTSEWRALTPDLHALALAVYSLELDAKIGKDRHFTAAERKEHRRLLLGGTAVVAAALVAGQALTSILTALSLQENWAKGLSALLSLVVVITTSMLGFLNLERQVAQHRSVGNAYIAIARRSRDLLRRISVRDASYAELNEEYSQLAEEYLTTNVGGESCPTSERDSKRAVALNASRRDRLKSVQQTNDTALLGRSGAETLPRS